ncbi:MAG: protease inhibitor I42 family protein [Acidobacteriia bacterium]|nr:protease inhibitor I42 family protein [Terriglobia bacterium]
MTPQQITTAAGEEFVVRLPAVATAGYQWEVRTLPPGIRLESPAPETIPGDRPGDTVTEVFRFRAEKAGDYSISFAYKRSWEATVVSTHTVTVRVQ